MNNTMKPTQTQSNKDVVISLIYSHFDSLPTSELDYREFLLNRIIRLQPQPKNPETGYSMRYQFIHQHIHISLQPKFWRRYQYFLLNEYSNGNHSVEVMSLLDKLINKSYKKVGKLYERVNKHYECISQYKQSLELA